MLLSIKFCFSWICCLKLLPAFVGPFMMKFTIALREIGTYKDVLWSQANFLISFSHWFDFVTPYFFSFITLLIRRCLLQVLAQFFLLNKASLLYNQVYLHFFSTLIYYVHILSPRVFNFCVMF